MGKLRKIFSRASKGNFLSSIPADHRQDLMESSSLSTGQMSFRQLMKAAWGLAHPFFMNSPEKNKARLLLAGVLGLTLAQVGVSALYNIWWGNFWDDLTRYDSGAIGKDFLQYVGIAIPGILTTAGLPLLNGHLHLRWRDWLTKDTQKSWFVSRAYNSLSHNDTATDNPDQRITNDTDEFIMRSLTMSTALLSATTTLLTFSGILLGLAGSSTLLGVAFAYAAGGTFVAHKIGRKLPFIHNNHRQFEADYRYGLVRARENAESIAFYGGEAVEQISLGRRFNRLVQNTRELIRTNFHVTAFASAHGTFASPLPIFALLPQFLGKKLA